MFSGNVEFSTKGTSGTYASTLIERPYLERWYHVAVVRQSESFSGYVDGRQVFSSTGNVGDAKSTDGLSIGGWNATGSKRYYFFGDIQEVAVYQSFTDRNFINEYMFADQPANDSSQKLKGYFKLGFSTNSADRLRNFAPPPLASGTETATTNGPVEFEEASRSGEQSKFDSLRNGGRDALTPLSGAFVWQQTALARPTPGIALDLRFGYSSANAFGGFKLGNADPYAAGALGPGWRHTFETRVIPSQDFLPAGSIETICLMSWDGSIETWDADLEQGIPTETYHTRHKEYRGELYFTNNFCEWRTPERLVYRYRHPFFGSQTQRGLLVDIRDFNSNTVQLLRNSSGVITQIVDSASGRFDFRYQGSLLTNVAFGSWQANFAYDATNRLILKTLTNTSDLYTGVSNTWQFQYGSNGLLACIRDPHGYTNVLVGYDQYGRQTNQADALGRVTATRYGVPGKRQITRIDPGTNSWVETYDRKGHILAQQDPLGNVTSYTYDSNGNRLTISQRQCMKRSGADKPAGEAL
ncbi:MAG: LamG-like jellyroll fold domain-containing protein, partial [Verrucomicrobiota bacterium]